VSGGGGPVTDLVDALDRVREVRGSLALFDGIVAGDPERVRAAIAAHPRHPLRAAVAAWLAERGVEAPTDEGPAAALARHGIDDLDAYVASATAREGALVRQLADAKAERDLALRSANAYALMAALLAAFAIGGWVAAVSGFPLPQEPEPERAPSRAPVTTEGS
jgi:hypothetical protein